jgi:molecular chaperone HtpG
MAIIRAAPQSIWECAIVSALREKSTPEGGAVEKVAAFVQTATPLVDLIISGPFKEYTLHNRDHAKKILHLACLIHQT